MVNINGGFRKKKKKNSQTMMILYIQQNDTN